MFAIPLEPQRALGRAVGRASPASSGAAQTGHGYLVKTFVGVFKATSPVLQGDHWPMKWDPNRCLHVLPPASSSFPNTECSVELFPITPFPFKSPPAQGTNLPQEKPEACREKAQPLLAGSSLSPGARGVSVPRQLLCS